MDLQGWLSAGTFYMSRLLVLLFYTIEPAFVPLWGPFIAAYVSGVLAGP